MLTINNLSAKIYRHRAAIIATETQVTDSGWFVLGPCGQEFERQFAAYLGAKHCIGVANVHNYGSPCHWGHPNIHGY